MTDDSAKRQFDRLRPDLVYDLEDAAEFLIRFEQDVVRRPTHESASLVVESDGTDWVLSGWVFYPQTLRALERLWKETAFDPVRFAVNVLPSETFTESFQSLPFFLETENEVRGYEKPSDTSPIVYVWRQNARIRILHQKGQWLLCSSRTGYLAWVRKEELRFHVPNDTDSGLPDDLEEVIEDLVSGWEGTPYVWGGNGQEGIDCSGFTQQIYLRLGFVLPRDADQQMLGGYLVSTHDHREPLLPGDLLFFTLEDGRIGHVALSLGGWRMIHAERPAVCVCSLDETAPDYNEDRARHFALAKRYLLKPRLKR